MSAREQSTLAELISDLPEDLRRQALTHSSWVGDDRIASYERLAYLGDSVLALAVADELVDRYPDEDAGSLTKIHNHAVSGVSCAEVGRKLGVPEMLRATEPGDNAGIPADVLLAGERPVPEATEALIGACFLAFGFEEVAGAVVAAFEPRILHAAETPTDFKSALQELLARSRTTVSYEITAETGPPHRRHFEVAAVVDSKRVGVGAGRSKKVAEQAAAKQALEKLGS